MKSLWLLRGALAASFLLTRAGASADDTLQEIVVTATLRSSSIAELPQSVTVLGQDTLQGAGVQHFEENVILEPMLVSPSK